jgi:hypothetical protein
MPKTFIIIFIKMTKIISWCDNINLKINISWNNTNNINIFKILNYGQIQSCTRLVILLLNYLFIYS